jgi:hypothetical protein
MRNVIFAWVVLASLSFAGCGDDDAGLGDPYVCGTTMCRTGQACIENAGDRAGTWGCAADRSCPDDYVAIYCPGAGSVSCSQMDFMLAVATDGPGIVRQTKLYCRY